MGKFKRPTLAVSQDLSDGYPSARAEGDRYPSARDQNDGYPSQPGQHDIIVESVAPARRDKCRWCKGFLPETLRADAVFCSKRCRQASWRFGRANFAAKRAEHPIAVAYADPPYPGLSARYYSTHPDFNGEVDHKKLISRLIDGWPDGWALSTSARALPKILRFCPERVAVAAWFRGAFPNINSFHPSNAWEPLIYCGGRQSQPSRLEERRLDAMVHVLRPRITDPNRVIGAKPAALCFWLFRLLGLRPNDQFDDLFPGSGGVSRAWDLFRNQSGTTVPAT